MSWIALGNLPKAAISEILLAWRPTTSLLKLLERFKAYDDDEIKEWDLVRRPGLLLTGHIVDLGST